MPGHIEFIASGPPRAVSRAIEEYARTDGHLTALVVPWESSDATVCMAVTAVKADGWAIEHINLGTIRLATDDRGEQGALGSLSTTTVAISAEATEHPDGRALGAAFDRFAHQLQHHFQQP